MAGVGPNVLYPGCTPPLVPRLVTLLFWGLHHLSDSLQAWCIYVLHGLSRPLICDTSGTHPCSFLPPIDMVTFVLSQVSHKGWIFLVCTGQLLFYGHPWAPAYPPYRCQCVWGRCVVNVERVHILRMQWLQKTWLEDMLFYVYAIKFWMANLMGPENKFLSTFSLLTLGKSCVYGFHQWTTVTTFERIIRSQLHGQCNG